METLRVAAVQFPMAEGITYDQLLTKIESHLREAKAGGAQLVVFPELITAELVETQGDEKDQLTQIAQEITPSYIGWITTKAQELGLAILGGTTPRVQGGEVRNTAVLAFENGKTILQDKMFLTIDEKQWDWTPGDQLSVFEAPWGATVIATCFDCEFPLVSQSLAPYHPDLILVPSWTSSMSGLNRVDWTARARAVEHFAYVVKTGTVPMTISAAPNHFGQATIVGPQDAGFSTEVYTGVLNKTEVVFADLDLALLRRQKKASPFYPVNEQDVRRQKFSVIKAKL